MRPLYAQVHPDEQNMQFYAECALSQRRIYSIKLPVLCRKKSLLSSLEKGRCQKVRQALYNKAHAAATQDLARYFNQCCYCGKWVCDESYYPEKMLCAICAEEKNLEKEETIWQTIYLED